MLAAGSEVFILINSPGVRTPGRSFLQVGAASQRGSGCQGKVLPGDQGAKAPYRSPVYWHLSSVSEFKAVPRKT